MKIKDEAVVAAAEAIKNGRPFRHAETARAALSAALPHMGGGSTKVFEHKGRVYFYEWRSDRWRNWWHFIGWQPVASHEPAPEPDEEAAREFVLDEFSPLQPEAEGASNPTDTQEVVAFLVDCPAQPTLEFANVHVPDSAEPLVRQSALTACQQEVERLRAELIKSRNYWSEQCSDLNQHNAELVKALEEIASDDERGDYEGVVQFARAALGGQSNEA